MESHAHRVQPSPVSQNIPSQHEATDASASSRTSPEPAHANASEIADGISSVLNDADQPDFSFVETRLPLASNFRRLMSWQRRSNVLEEFVAAIGDEATAKIIDEFAGTRLYIPDSPTNEDQIVVSIGLAAAIKLAEIYGGDRVEVPNPTPRRIQIRQLRANGQTVDAIARRLRCTRRRVYQVLAEARMLHHPD